VVFTYFECTILIGIQDTFSLTRSSKHLSRTIKYDIKPDNLYVDVGGQRCPDSVRIYCAVFVSQYLKCTVGRVFECPDFEFELDFDRQTPHSNSGQNLDSAVRRRLPVRDRPCPTRDSAYIKVEKFSKTFRQSS